ncbi:MAG: UvrD-helicase domain-containing protein, partial [Rubrivivax sp.]|nr:UvrD-helicase domain-containing protein [Rubrivivax sp.]
MTGAATTVDSAALAAAHGAARALWQDQRATILAQVAEALPRLNGRSYKASTVAAATADWDALLAGDDALRGGLDRLDLLAAQRLQPNKGKAPVQPHDFFDCAQALLDLRDAAGQALALARLQLLRQLLEDGPPALRRAKRERRVIAFDDMLFNLHQRLQGAAGQPLADALRQRFAAALIDEFQDTDPLQFQIFERIHGGGDTPLFLVGDPKQAIYSFRHADLHTYLQARHQAVAEYTLADNQRSTAPLLTALNALFGSHPRAFMLPGLDYRPVGCGAKPRPPLVDNSEPRAPLQLWTLPTADAGSLWLKARAQHSAADACAAEIARLLGASRQGLITLAERPFAAGDIAVLVRSHAQGALMRRTLAALGVGAVEHSQASVYASVDAEELEQLLAAVLEPSRPPLLRAALATALLGLDAQGLCDWDADDRAQLNFMVRLAGYRETWLRRGVGVM